MATSSEQTARLGFPDSDRVPKTRSLFEHARNGHAQLLPLFDELGPGAVVPAMALMRGGVEWGRFYHKNTEDEVTICFGSRGGLLEAGSVQVGGKMHGVNSFLLDPTDPDAFMLLVISQLQSEFDQQESITFRCSECNHKLFEFEFSASDPPGTDNQAETWPGQDGDSLGFFVTQWGSWAAGQAFNESEENRTCEKCGRLNDRFPVESWGWGSYVERHALVSDAHRGLSSPEETEET